MSSAFSTSITYPIALAALKQADPVLAHLIDRLGECRLDREQHTGDLFSVLSKSILSQQISTKAAAAIHSRFIALYPESLLPEKVLDTPDDVLRQVGISRPKIIYLKDLAQNIQDGLPTLAELDGMDDEAIIQTLIPVKGIGRWTVQMLLIFRLHRWNVLPVDDLGIRAAVRRAYHLDDLPTQKAVRALGQSWQPYCTIASWYLWRSLDFTQLLPE
jgi:DNA-3-methyladenine glycosylase II